MFDKPSLRHGDFDRLGLLPQLEEAMQRHRRLLGFHPEEVMQRQLLHLGLAAIRDPGAMSIFEHDDDMILDRRHPLRLQGFVWAQHLDHRLVDGRLVLAECQEVVLPTHPVHIAELLRNPEGCAAGGRHGAGAARCDLDVRCFSVNEQILISIFALNPHIVHLLLCIHTY